MANSISQRPGVYSDLEASTVRYSGGGGRTAGLLCLCQSVEPGLYTVGSVLAAASAFGGDEEIARLCGLMLRNGAASVVCSVYNDDTGLEAAANRFCTEENAYVLFCGSGNLDAQQALLAAAISASGQRREKICVFGMDGATVEKLCARAAIHNSERALLVGSSGDGISAGAAMTGVICAQGDPSAPMVDLELLEVEAGGMYSDQDFDDLILGGVTPVESSGGSTRAVRAVTTRTTTQGSADQSFRELNTILIADEVITGVRSSLTALFRRAKNNARTREAIRSQVIMELESRVENEIIEQYGEVTAQADSDDPTLCLVSFDFTVAHGLNRVHLSAVITV